MKKLISRLFGASSRAAHVKGTSSNRDNPLTIEDGSDNATRRQLVQVLLRDVMRRHGMPPQWVEGQMQLVSSRSRGPGMSVRLVVRHWDDRLMRYAFAFESELMADITRFDPLASHWLHGVSWQLEVAGSCPYLTLPDKAFWQEPAQPAPHVPASARPPSATSPSLPVAAAVAPAAADFARTHPGTESSPAAAIADPTAGDTAAHDHENDPLKDLERLFVIRDQELGRQAADGVARVGYEPTQPSSL